MELRINVRVACIIYIVALFAISVLIKLAGWSTNAPFVELMAITFCFWPLIVLWAGAEQLRKHREKRRKQNAG
jgi:hypothetical protein